MRITTDLNVVQATEGNKQNVKQKKSTANTLGIKNDFPKKILPIHGHKSMNPKKELKK